MKDFLLAAIPASITFVLIENFTNTEPIAISLIMLFGLLNILEQKKLKRQKTS